MTMFFYPRNCFVAMMMMILGSVLVDAANWSETYIPYNNDIGIDDDSFYPYTRDDPKRQHLHLFKTPSNLPTPVYFYSHSNGAKASQITTDLDIFADSGYSVISWESVTHLVDPEDTITCFDDFDLVWSWFQDNAAQHNLDPNSVVIGGRSRGSACSWEMAHSEKPEIQGIYMYNALPKAVWRDGSTIWEDIVTPGSPPAHLVYNQECLEKPITQDCVTDPDEGDGHNPWYGQIIVNRYDELGIASIIELTDGLKNKGMGIFDLFPAFAASLNLEGTCTAKMTELCQHQVIVSPKKCMKCAKNKNEELSAAGCTKPIVLDFCGYVV